MQLTFMGATHTVTGSKYLLSVDSKKILIDCGLFQGLKELRLRNWHKLPIRPDRIDAVILTHAHIDHSGYLPLLVKNGFTGPVYCTSGTMDLCSILLPDSGFLQEEEAALANRYGYSKHKPALPLYTKEDALRALKYFKPINFGTIFNLFDDVSFIFQHAGHILGAAFVNILCKGKSLFFTGDMGRPHDVVMRAPEIIKTADYLVIESTYGDHSHETESPKEKLGEIIRQTAARGGSVIIPAFAVGRAQSLLYFIYQLKKENKIPDLPVFLDSPMAINTTELLNKHLDELRLSKEQCAAICSVAHYIKTPEESYSIDNLKFPAIIISASGMATGGRILRHLEIFAPDTRNTLIFTGYQAEKTRGDRILKGESEIKIHGRMIPIKARVELISNASAHADYKEILTWLSHFSNPPQKVFITHGELKAALSLKNKIVEKFGWTCILPKYLQEEVL